MGAANAQRQALTDLCARRVIGDDAFHIAEAEIDLLDLSADARIHPEVGGENKKIVAGLDIPSTANLLTFGLESPVLRCSITHSDIRLFIRLQRIRD